MQLNSPDTPEAIDRSTTPVVESTTPVTSEAPAKSDSTWLADLPVLDSSSVDDSYDKSPWTMGEARVERTIHKKSVSAKGAWCASAHVAFALDGKYEKFSAQVAIASDSVETRKLDFYVLADDNRVAEIQNVGPTPQPVDLPVTGVTKLALGLEPPDNDKTACPGPERIGVWADPTLTAATPPGS